MFTLSQLVDEMVSELKRPNLSSEITRYVNQTIRELHTDENNRIILYAANFKELQLTADSETAYTWEVTNPTLFQLMQAVQYPNVFDQDNNAVWAQQVSPGRHNNDRDYYFYRAGDTFVFSGYGGEDALINLGYYEFPRSLKYYEDDATRPAEYDEDDGWTYPAGAATDEDQEAARNQVTNWLLMRWSDVVSEGVRAKLYKRVSDLERARTSYSLYSQLRIGLWTSETARLVENTW